MADEVQNGAKNVLCLQNEKEVKGIDNSSGVWKTVCISGKSIGVQWYFECGKGCGQCE